MINNNMNWAAFEADKRAETEERKATYWKKIGTKNDKPKAKRKFPMPRENTAKDFFGWNAGKNEISSKEIWEQLVGSEVSRDHHIDSQINKRRLREQSEDVVLRLERMGIRGRTGRDLAIVGLVSGEVEALPDYRNCNLIPIQQSKNVHGMLSHVRFMFDVTRPGRLRMLVISGGWCPLFDYRKNHKTHTRRMSKFAAHPKLKRLGISIEYYNVENTIHRNDNNTAMMNMHSHVLFRCNRYLGKKKWAEFLEFSKGFFPKGYVNDSKIKKPNEVVKYVFKPTEFNLLTDEEFAELFHQVSGGRAQFDPETGEVKTREDENGELVEVLEGPLKFFHPLGEMRRFRSELKANGQKLMLIQTIDGRLIWRVTEKKTREERPDSDGSRTENVVVAITRPMPNFNPRMEPCVIVEGYTGDFTTLVRENSLEEAVGFARRIHRDRIDADALRAATESLEACSDTSLKRSAPMKHTTTTTVPKQDTNSRSRYRPPPPSGHASNGETLQ